ncbi:MAG: mechanosensitive ion channel family protein [Clostridiaceae bacterium]|nr:mechanosensitive ion channel family protein [Clostridiaceae bacterium]
MNINQALDTTAGALGKLSLISILYALATFIVCFIVKKAVVKLISAALNRTKLDSKLSGFVIKGLNAVLWVVIGLIVGDSLGINLTSMVALFSVVGLAFSLAIQDSLSNLAGGIMLLSNRPFKIGDYVEAAGQEGTVQSIGIIYTQLTTVDNRLVFIPNSSISSSKIINYSAQPSRRIEIKISASYDDSTQKVKAALLETATQNPGVLTSPIPTAVIAQYGESSITYSLRVWASNSNYWDVSYSLNEAIRETFIKNGITMTYNHVNVHLMKD